MARIKKILLISVLQEENPLARIFSYPRTLVPIAFLYVLLFHLHFLVLSDVTTPQGTLYAATTYESIASHNTQLTRKTKGHITCTATNVISSFLEEYVKSNLEGCSYVVMINSQQQKHWDTCGRTMLDLFYRKILHNYIAASIECIVLIPLMWSHWDWSFRKNRLSSFYPCVAVWAVFF